MSSGFYDASDPQNQIKSKMVLKYFWAWKTIMLPHLKNPHDRLAYLDLFSGPGRFEDGTPSTPLGILEEAINDRRLCDRLVTVFNDADTKYVEHLRTEIAKLPGIGKLAIQPRITNFRIGIDAIGEINSVSRYPTLFFIDPFGYAGLSIEMIGNAIRPWGCDCIFFFNYNRIGPALSNSIVEFHMDQLFGKSRANRLRGDISGVSSNERKRLVLTALIDGLREVGGKYVLPFEFKSNSGARTSHYIVFVSKSSVAYHIMKNVMASVSTDDSEVKNFEFVPIKSPQLRLPLVESRAYTIDALKQLLLEAGTVRVLKVKDIYEKYTFDTPYTLENVKSALLQLEAEKQVEVDLPPERRMRGGRLTLGDDRWVTFRAKE